VLLWTLLFSVIHAPAADLISEFSPAESGYRFEFPRDHGTHDTYRTEWWYYTGHLTAKDGRQFGYQLTLFRRGMPPDRVKTLPSKWSITQLYLAHFAVTDLAHRRFVFRETVSRPGLGKAGSEAGRLHAWIDQWSIESAAAPAVLHTLKASENGRSLHLELRPSKPPVVHGLNGISRKGKDPGQASHYYSLTRMATTGTLTIGDESFDVTGASWMDHEFG
jgi:predicted secreted hydrolase